MVTAAGDLVTIDEWPKKEQCKKFFHPRWRSFLLATVYRARNDPVYNSIDVLGTL